MVGTCHRLGSWFAVARSMRKPEYRMRAGITAFGVSSDPTSFAAGLIVFHDAIAGQEFSDGCGAAFDRCGVDDIGVKFPLVPADAWLPLSTSLLDSADAEEGHALGWEIVLLAVDWSV